MSFSINFIDEDYCDEQAHEISCWVDEVSKEYMESPYYDNLSDQEKDNCFFLLNILFEYAYSYCLVGPGKLDTDVLSEMMLDVIPRKVSADKETFESFPNIFASFMLWCEEKNYIKNTEKLRKYVVENNPKMVESSQTPSKWGFAKSFMMGGDMPSLDNILPHINKATTVKRDKLKVGRNESCTCGSGKKYKKCCMLTVVN